MQFSQTSNHGLRLHLVLLLKCNDKFSFLNTFFLVEVFRSSFNLLDEVIATISCYTRTLLR